MNYPVWELKTLGGGTLIALISILHVYIAHLAVGGGLFIWLTDLKGFRDNNHQIHTYVQKHTWFFLLLTMVFGGVSGVGIWFIIALVNPAATSSLIHNFVFGWAIEWVFFLGEITALLVYYYKFNQLNRKHRLNIAFLYFAFAWLSLFIINGILSFMLTPGTWLETRSFWDGFFNPTFFSSLFFRTFMTIMIAGLFGYITSVFIKDESFRQTMMKYCSKWLLFPLPGLVLSALWYYYSVPADIRYSAFSLNPQTTLFINGFIILTVVLFVFGIVQSLRVSLIYRRLITFGLVIIGLLWMGGFEYTREIARKPYVIGGFMYSTSMLKSESDNINQTGVLASARWTPHKQITPENQIQAGSEIYNLQCISCHTVNGIRNDIVPRSESLSFTGMVAQLTGQGKILTYMPPFVGTDQEKSALAAYIIKEIHGKDLNTEAAAQEIKTLTEDPAPFDAKEDEYVLLAWNDLGMHCVSDSDPWFVILPPANTLEAQLIRRGPTPVMITEGVELAYTVQDGFNDPAAQVPFWDYAESNFGTSLARNTGLFGNGLKGTFRFNEDRGSFIAEGIPVVPYKDDGSYNPYPVFTIEARDTASGEMLISAKVVAPVSTEMGCRNCHEGGWRFNNIAGIDAETSTNILAVHDRLNDTELLKMARNGKPQLCQSCHEDPALGAKGKVDVLNFSAAMHGWHANYMPYNDERACAMCHPAAEQGATRCNRGIHNSIGLVCIDCHGTMQEHGLALLKGQAEKPPAKALMAHLKTSTVGSAEEVNPRMPWLNEPDCLTCHKDFQQPEMPVSAFNKWNDDFAELYRIRTDNAGIRCEACHGATHAVYPAENPYGRNRDNLQPIQYSEMPLPIGSNLSCAVCHQQEMEFSIHHENMVRMFRNSDLIE